MHGSMTNFLIMSVGVSLAYICMLWSRMLVRGTVLKQFWRTCWAAVSLSLARTMPFILISTE